MTPGAESLGGLALRIGLFLFIGFAGAQVFPWLFFSLGGYFVGAALGVFAAAATANAIVARIYERGALSSIGLAWGPHSGRQLLLGLGMGGGAALTALGVPLLLLQASFAPAPEAPFRWGSLLLVTIVLLFGAIGEEMLFHGYAFQVLLQRFGAYRTILPFAVLFGAMHLGNPNASPLGIANTVLWGLLFGVAYLRSGALWLPIGLHYGWNVVLPLFGVNLSGFTMTVTGYKLAWSGGSLWSGGDYGPEGSLLTTAVVTGALALLYQRRVPGGIDEDDPIGEPGGAGGGGGAGGPR
jgi:membrane protease YdiL (CAAX protease family)